MSRLPWQVVSHWLPANGSEYVYTSGFATLAEARQEDERLLPSVGLLRGGQLLRSVQLFSDPESMLLQHAKQIDSN
jgi:hypothetical protein